VGENTNIEWATHTFNPWVGCTKISPGCDHCYAEGWAKRSGLVTWGEARVRTSIANWNKPHKWNREAAAKGTRPRVFCASLADVFDNEADCLWRVDLFRLIEHTPHIDWLLLTKRIGNVPDMTNNWQQGGWPKNVWLGITVVNQEEADRDISKLLRVPAAVRFLSCEPLLEMISLDHEWLVPEYFGHSPDCRDKFCALNGDMHSCVGEVVQQPSIDWIICGGESGPHAREMNPDWARLLREQCKDTGAAFFMKQMTGKAEIPEDLLIREFPSVDKGNAP
jgi:protein gp37